MLVQLPACGSMTNQVTRAQFHLRTTASASSGVAVTHARSSRNKEAAGEGFVLMPNTKRVFRFFHGAPLALFPAIPATPEAHLCASYANVGQHGAANPLLVVGSSRLATRKEYAPLAQELRRRGYRLKICKRITSADRAERASELR